MPAGNAYPSGHLVPSPIVGLACAPIVETRYLEYLLVLSRFCSVLHLRQDSLATRIMTRIDVGLARSYVKFLLSSWKTYMCNLVYQQIVGIPMGTNCAPLIADLFLYCYERDFMSDLQKSKRHDLIDMFNDTSRYLDDIFTIDNPEFEKYMPDIYIQQNFS